VFLGEDQSRWKKEVLIPKEEIQKRVKELGQQISRDYEAKEPVLIGVLNGVIFFFADLVRAMSIPAKLDFVRAASYGASMSSSGEVRFTKELEIPVKGRPVIIVEDIVDTGLTLVKIIENIRRKGPESLRVCVLIDKTERRQVDVPVDYRGFEVPKGFLVGYGLDFNEQYRYLRDIFVLEPEEGVDDSRRVL